MPHYDRSKADFDGVFTEKIPEELREELLDWVHDAKPPSRFVDRILLGDLFGAAKIAGDAQQQELFEAIPYVALWLWYCAPFGTVQVARDHDVRRRLLYTYQGTEHGRPD